MTDTREHNFTRLRESRDEYRDALSSVDDIIIGHKVLEAGYHPLKGGRGLTEILVRRHRSEPHSRPPDLTQADVVALADELGISPQFEPSRRIDL